MKLSSRGAMARGFPFKKLTLFSRSEGPLLVFLKLVALVPLAIIAVLIALFLYDSWPAWEEYGPALIVTAAWNPQKEVYGILPALIGTSLTSLIAVALAAFFSVAFVVLLYEYLPARVASFFGTVIDLAAALPTVVYGLWGLFVLAPVMAKAQGILYEYLGFLQFGGVGPFSARPTSGFTVLTASLLLAVMITPFATAVIREGYASVPKEIVEAAHSLTSYRWEIARIKLLYIKHYIFSGLVLALGRAFGETVAVAMVIGGNAVNVVRALTEPGISVSALIALQFPTAQAYQYMLPTLFAAALIMAVIGFVINAVAVYYLLRRA